MAKQEANAKKNKNPHAGHRERMRRKVRKNGFEDFEEHEILEYVLYHVIRRGNTNEVGHALLNTFGSVGEVFRASHQELMQVPGVGQACADYIVYLRELFQAMENYRFEGQTLQEADARCRYFLHKLDMETDEHLLVACLDDNMEVRLLFTAATGTPDHVTVNRQTLARNILYSHCNTVVLAHNHPKGKPIPSIEDIRLTTSLSNMLKLIGIHLDDHIIVGDGRAVSMLQLGAYSTPGY